MGLYRKNESDDPISALIRRAQGREILGTIIATAGWIMYITSAAIATAVSWLSQWMLIPVCVSILMLMYGLQSTGFFKAVRDGWRRAKITMHQLKLQREEDERRAREEWKP